MEFYPMPMFNKLLVSDIEKSEKWYEKALGFKSIFKFRNDKSVVLMNHLRLDKYQDIMLIQSNNFIVGDSNYLNILVEDIERLANRISPKVIVDSLEQQPWNAIEMTITDPDGHLITLTQSNVGKEDFDVLIKKASKLF
ncbi:VOC family protein [Enterococcus crotali]|uniref:VOC family protein n=1 Tax=Enterococcus crotali TaxID=1453587 RepID=UPI00046EDC96|nr:VOC family protein [Enterococcus crotali]